MACPWRPAVPSTCSFACQTDTIRTYTTETGVKVQVPLFIEAGNTIRVDTRNGQYVTRV
ncbi:MAG: hypothetical protein IH787_08730 [Nitrospirae bacterium]|nr:hypothetical protein [Nitrospirota bacterium]